MGEVELGVFAVVFFCGLIVSASGVNFVFKITKMYSFFIMVDVRGPFLES